MKKQVLEIASLGLALLALVVVFRFAIPTRSQGNSVAGEEPGNIAQLLEERLKQLDVSVISVKVTSQSPLAIEITLQSPGDEEHFSQVDYWNLCITMRETELAYLNFDTHIDSYRTIILNSKGQKIYGSTGYLNADTPSQQLNPGTPSDVDRSETKNVLS